ncbi:uncharacterized protein LOC34620932 [Cyclospora cayetanensis]|uniref:Uncharacterized protein LOC34620932 n=2 Tax=Cyclospora cayetanensis TaxID=88456 RepID=A0A6P5WCK1_9EIME|nr:uncharacterized protein LOC34620932 [Cyclospora cayetanensis]OEH74181.1 hypothetical protein cyc_04393 [Cyclospora cayetanensis]
MGAAESSYSNGPGELTGAHVILQEANEEDHQEGVLGGGEATATVGTFSPMTGEPETAEDPDHHRLAGNAAGNSEATESTEDEWSLSSHCAGQKHMRVMGLEALLQLPKLALAELFWSDEEPLGAPLGPRAAAEKVRHSRDPPPAASSLSARANRYRAFLLRERLEVIHALDSNPSSNSGGNEASTDTRGLAEYDFVSIASLAAMGVGVCMRPSWSELAQQVGTYKALRLLKARLERDKQQLRESIKDKIARRRQAVGSHSREGDVDDGSRTSGMVLGHTGSGKTRYMKDIPEAYKISDMPGSLSASKQLQHPKQQRHQEPPAVSALQLPDRTQSLSSLFAGHSSLQDEITLVEAMRTEIEEDISVLENACAELEALLRRVWTAEKLPREKRMERLGFRRLWCHPQGDREQAMMADKLFALCFSYIQASSNTGSRGTVSGSSSPSAFLSYNELLDALPPKALEYLWYTSELRRKERQQYRYFWI